MKRLFLSVWQWLFGNKKAVEVTAPLQTPTMSIVKDEPEEDKVEAILNGNAPEPQFMDVEGSNEILEQQEPQMNMVEEPKHEKGSYEPLKFEVKKDNKTFLLTEKQYVFYTIIAKSKKVRGVEICKAYLEYRNPTGMPTTIPHWKLSMSSHKNTMNYLYKTGLIKKVGKFYSVK